MELTDSELLETLNKVDSAWQLVTKDERVKQHDEYLLLSNHLFLSVNAIARLLEKRDCIVERINDVYEFM